MRKVQLELAVTVATSALRLYARKRKFWTNYWITTGPPGGGYGGHPGQMGGYLGLVPSDPRYPRLGGDPSLVVTPAWRPQIEDTCMETPA